MPINLRYGQQAAARGFINQQRLQQVLSKQKQLADQGKKVSIRMILEKAKLLTPAQLSQIDHDLNIKVVKKKTGKMERAEVEQRKSAPKPTPKAPKPVGAQDFAGEAVPQFSGMSGGNVDVTLFSPPPADMQDRIRQERDRAKADARRKQDDDAAGFFGDESASPFGSDPFSDDAMSPEPAGTMEPVGMEPEPFDAEMQPEPFNEEMAPEPVMGRADLQPTGFDDDEGFSDTPRELSRMESSPKISALSAEVDGFASPEDEELPAVSGFGEDQEAPPSWQQPRQPQYAGPPSAALAPAGDDFDGFGNDIRSPEELEAGPAARPGGNMDATMFSPAPSVMPPARQKTGAMDRTTFSPPPPGMRPRERQPEPEPEPEPDGNAWGESGLEVEPAFGAEAAATDATVFSPPPPEVEERRKATRESQRLSGKRIVTDDFADVDMPTGKRMDDVPTAPAQGEEVHPLRRGVGTSSSSIPRRRTTSRKVAVPDDFGADDGVDTSLPDVDETDEKPADRGAGKMPPPKLPKSERGAKDKKREPERAAETGKQDKGKKKSTSSRVILLFLLLLAIVLALLITPVAYPDHGIEQLTTLREHERTKPIYDYVEKVYKPIREMLGLPDPAAKKKPPEIRTIPGSNPAPSNAPTNDEGSSSEPPSDG